MAGEFSHLSKGQRQAVEEIFGSRDQVIGFQGRAGTGKTASLAAIREAAEREGYQVEGLAPTSRAAQALEEAGIRSSTLQYHLARSHKANGGHRHLYVVDESSLASTRQVNEFLHRLEGGDRVIFVGDSRQHQAVEAGRPFQQLQEAGMRTAHLDEIIRQKDPALKQAVEQLAGGEVRAAIQNLRQQGRVHGIRDRQERLEAIAKAYAEHPEQTLVISPDNKSRQEINSLIHRERQSRRRVGQQEHQVRVLVPRQEITGDHELLWRLASDPSPPELWRWHANNGQIPPGANGPQYLELRRSELVSSLTRFFALEPKGVYRPQQSVVEDACA